MAKHEIIIKDKTRGGKSHTSPGRSTYVFQTMPKEEVLHNVTTAVGVGSIVKNIFQSGLGRIGSYTGDYVTQNKINTGIGNLATLGALATMNIAAIGAVVANTTFKMLDQNLQIRKAEVETEYYKRSIGLSSYKQSRYGGKKV